MSVGIRVGEASDAAALAELAARTFRETFAADNRPEDLALHMARSFGPAQQEHELLDPAVATLLAEIDGQLAGYAQLREGMAPACVTGEGPGFDATCLCWTTSPPSTPVCSAWCDHGPAVCVSHASTSGSRHRVFADGS